MKCVWQPLLQYGTNYRAMEFHPVIQLVTASWNVIQEWVVDVQIEEEEVGKRLRRTRTDGSKYPYQMNLNG